MPEPLWRIRQRKGMSVTQLAAKSGVPAISISEYESGRAIRSADLPKLAKALYVEEWEIELQSKPAAKRERPRPPTPAPPQPARPRPKKTPAPVRQTQIEHLLTLASHRFGKDRAALEEELGKPLEELTRQEASELLKRHQMLLSEAQPHQEPNGTQIKRRRAYLPEGVDEFELRYLTSHQEAGTALHFTLFDGQQLSGHIVGFSPYSITIREAETGEEVTLQKLAIAYYRAKPSEPHEQPSGDV